MQAANQRWSAWPRSWKLWYALLDVERKGRRTPLYPSLFTPHPIHFSVSSLARPPHIPLIPFNPCISTCFSLFFLCISLTRLFFSFLARPHLGNAFKQVVAVGLSYFFFAGAYGVTHAMGQVCLLSTYIYMCVRLM